MSLYDNYLNPENLYSRPSSMMNTVSNYLGTNQPSMPMGNTPLSNMSVSLNSPQDKNPYTNQSMDNDNSEPYTTAPSDLVGTFISKIQGLNENQRSLLLTFIGSDGGVDPEEYAKIFGVSKEYANRFQGLPNFQDLQDQIDNVFAYQSQQTGFEQQQAREANISASLSNRLTGGLGRGETNSLSRRQLRNTLNQRLNAVKEATAGKYGQLQSDVLRAIQSGFSTAGDIFAQDPYATSSRDDNYRDDDFYDNEDDDRGEY